MGRGSDGTKNSLPEQAQASGTEMQRGALASKARTWGKPRRQSNRHFDRATKFRFCNAGSHAGARRVFLKNPVHADLWRLASDIANACIHDSRAKTTNPATGMLYTP